jgi:hypothetical protein
MKKVVHKYKLGEEPSDLEYWLTKTPQERLAALEAIRQKVHGNISGKVERVITIIKLKDKK